MVLPPHLLDRYQQDFRLYDQSVSIIHQMTLQKFMEQGYWDRHIRKMRNVYQKKQRVLITEIMNRLGDRVCITGNEAGLHILLEVKNRIMDVDIS
jgi:GntR family transcriptional regulator/MocR family aminotransferase